MNDPLQIQPHEYADVIQRLRRRFLTTTQRLRWGIDDVYLGIAHRDGKIDDQRELAVVFQVTKKYQRLPSSVDRLPAQVVVYLWRGGKRRRYYLATDVEEVDEIVPSGRWLYLTNADTSTRRRVTCGCILTWQTQSQDGPQTFWAVATVGHAWGELPVGPTDIPVTIESRFGPPFTGRLIASTGRNGLDVAMVIVDPESLRVDGIDLTRRQRWLTIGELTDDYRRTGQSLDVLQDGVNLEIETPPQPRQLGVLGIKQQIIQARSENGEAFQPGSSGTIWLLRDRENSFALAAIQLATRRGDYSVGYGQVLDQNVFDWLRQTAIDFQKPVVLVPRSFTIVRGF